MDSAFYYFQFFGGGKSIIERILFLSFHLTDSIADHSKVAKWSKCRDNDTPTTVVLEKLWDGEVQLEKYSSLT